MIDCNSVYDLACEFSRRVNHEQRKPVSDIASNERLRMAMYCPCIIDGKIPELLQEAFLWVYQRPADENISNDVRVCSSAWEMARKSGFAMSSGEGVGVSSYTLFGALIFSAATLASFAISVIAIVKWL